MKNKLLVTLLSLFGLTTACFSQKKSDLKRIEDLKPIFELYDSILQNGGWISLTQFNNKPTRIVFKKKDFSVLETGADSINDPQLESLIATHRSDLTPVKRLFTRMQEFNPDYFSVACSGDPEAKSYKIILSYQWDKLTLRNYFYEYINGEESLKEAYANKNLEYITGHVFKGSGIER